MEKNIYKVQVLYEDTDHSGFAYHGNYLKYCERARQNLIGVINMKNFWTNNINFAITNINIDYLNGAVFGDSLEIRTEFSLVGYFKAIANQTISNIDNAKTVAKVSTTLICINEKKKLVKIPDQVKVTLLL